MPIWELISSRWLVNQSLWSSKKLTRFSHFWPWCKWLWRQNLELNPYTKEEWCHSTHTRHRLTGTTYKTFWLLKPKLFDECWVNANLTSLYSNINHCNRYHYQENWNKHELHFIGFVYLWDHDQLKYDIIYPVLTLFQLQYKLTIRSQALLSANLYYIKFNNLQVSRLFP